MRGSHVFNLHQQTKADIMNTTSITRNTRAVLRFIKDAYKAVEHEKYCAGVYEQKFAPFDSVDKGTALEFLAVQDVIIWC